MKLPRIIIPLLVMALGSFSILSSTLARYTSEYSGADTALVAKWDFRVGTTADNLQNQGFTFDIFDDQELSPQDKGENSFVVSGGESDVVIEYQIFMNTNALLHDVNEAQLGIQYPPLIFYISSLSATVITPYNSWFDLNDMEIDSDGYCLVATGQMEANSAELQTITIHWWWNTSFYVGTPNSDDSETGNYYALAMSIYESLVDDYNTKVNAANTFYTQHVRIVTTENNVEVVSYDCPAGASCPITLGAEGGDIDGAHMAAHAALLAEVDSALNAVNNSLKCQYDAYDTKAVAALKDLEVSEPEGILFKVIGNQVAPVQ